MKPKSMWPLFIAEFVGTALLLCEIITTSALIITVFVFAGSKRLRNYTPFTIPFLYCFMVWAETSYSGCSTNPARNFGPAFIATVLMIIGFMLLHLYSLL